MDPLLFALLRAGKTLYRRLRQLRVIAKGIASTSHPILAQLVLIRRCNLACSYCNEFDHYSEAIPIETIGNRIDKLANLGTSIVTISGGEPLLHPDLDDVIRHIRARGMLAGVLTNGYFLTAGRIQRFNDAGLDLLQVSVDNVTPDVVSSKSLKVLDRKLQLLAKGAHFDVNVNAVIGGGIYDVRDVIVIARRAMALQVNFSTSIVHDGGGQAKPLTDKERDVYYAVRQLKPSMYSRLFHFQRSIVGGQTNTWRCRAGGRYLYIDEKGLVHYCSQQRGYPGRALSDYTRDDIRREYLTAKRCSPNCTVSCSQLVALADCWRDPQTLAVGTVLNQAVVQITPSIEQSGPV